MKPTDRFLDTLESCLWHAGDSPDHAELARLSLFLLLMAGEGTPTADGGARIQLEVRSSTVWALRAACLPLTGVDEAGLEESQVFELLAKEATRDAAEHVARIQSPVRRPR